MIDPPLPASIMGGTTALIVFHNPVRLMSRVSCHCRAEISQSRPQFSTPAFATTISRRPNSSSASDTTRCWPTASRTSTRSARILRASPSTRLTVSARSSGCEGGYPLCSATGPQASIATMSAPARASRTQCDRPCPRAAPVTYATLPARGRSVLVMPGSSLWSMVARSVGRDIAGQCRGQHVKTQPAEIECAPVKLLQRHTVGEYLIAELLPDALAHSVGGGLAGPTQIPVELEAQRFLRLRAMGAQKRPCPAGVPYPAVGSGQPAVHTDVDHHAGGAKPLCVQHAHSLTRVAEITELGHQPLGVQRPALAVPGHPAAEPAPAVQHVGQHDCAADLQVMARHTLVIHRGGLLPGVKRRDPRRDRPPHPARAAQVLRWAGVVDPAGLRRRDPA